DVAITNSGFTLDRIHTAIGAKIDDGKPVLGDAPAVFPAGSRIDVQLEGLAAAADVLYKDAAGGFAHMTARLLAADGKELALVSVDDFSGKSSESGAAGSIGRVHFKGDPSFTKGLLASEPVRDRAADALTVLEAAGISSSIGV